jgi:hypothetical protein
VFRAPIPDFRANDSTFEIEAKNASAGLCPSDSGSAFVTVENGVATFRGVASNKQDAGDCKTPSGTYGFTDVFAYRDWIVETLKKGSRTLGGGNECAGSSRGLCDSPQSEAELSGNTRIRWTGDGADGTMRVLCPASETHVGPLNVVGVEERINCAVGQMQTASCAVDPTNDPGPIRHMLSATTARTLSEDGVVTVETRKAHANKVRWHRRFPAGVVSSEYTCEIGTQRSGGRVGGVGPVSGNNGG